MRLFLLFVALTAFCAAPAQTTNQWTWQSGDSTSISYHLTVYGVKGVPAIGNSPGGRFNSASFTDKQGNFWLFGGQYFKEGEDGDYYKNDLWKYSPTTKLWTWINGDSADNRASVFGIRGKAAPENSPGAREYPAAWVDSKGNFWMYGGYNPFPSYNINSELWMYNPNSNQWTWVNGDTMQNQRPVFGLKGFSDPISNPGCRNLSTTWVGKNDELWLFGGETALRLSNAYYADMNDLWKYNTVTNQWTWMRGDSIPYNNGSPGVKGATKVTNEPGCTAGSIGWTDQQGDLWFFTRYYQDNRDNEQYTNEVWKYNPTINEWVWQNGDTILNSPAHYGKKGIIAKENTPNGRIANGVWTDNENNAWFFGGMYSRVSEELYTNYNDLWKYDATANQWVWVAGDSIPYQPIVYGEKSVASAKNTPGSRYNMNSWKDVDGNFWLFGGVTEDSNLGSIRNDAWSYQPNAKLAPLCPALASTVLSCSIVGSSYQWQLSTDSGYVFTNIADNNYYLNTNSAVLTLTNIPSSFYGYQYRCVVNNQGTNPTTIQFANNWTGAVSDAWENPSNWSCGTLPDANTDVILDKGSLVIGSNVACRSLRVNAGATITVKPGYTLTITH